MDLVVVTLLWSMILVEGDTEVSCVFMERCILPCTFQVGPKVVIHWVHLKGLNVHFYSNNQDQLGYQHLLYRNRTSLFKDQISRGNASLQLTGVKVQDGGRYECYISTINGDKDSFINVKVEAPVHEVNIQQVENRITCSSEGIYPQPQLTWSTTPPSNISLHNTTTVQQNEQQLYSISSSLILSHSHTDLVYSCTVSTPTNRRTATLSKTGNSVSVGGITIGVVAAILAVVAAVGLSLYYKKPTGNEGNRCHFRTEGTQLMRLESNGHIPVSAQTSVETEESECDQSEDELASAQGT